MRHKIIQKQVQNPFLNFLDGRKSWVRLFVQLIALSKHSVRIERQYLSIRCGRGFLATLFARRAFSASSGIGLAMAQHLADKCKEIITVSRRASKSGNVSKPEVLSDFTRYRLRICFV
ncbi:MAG: hypothetical protein SNJ55_05400 [Chloroherpetonaceae bacterium]